MAAGAALAEVYDSIEGYYSRKVARYGATPLGVDWSCVPTQELRFVQLLKLCDFSAPFSLNDLGCGYGAVLAYLAWRHTGTAIDYLGIDLVPAMIRHAKRLWRDRPHTAFLRAHASPRIADYSIASGIFNVMQDQPAALWQRFVAVTLTEMRATSRRGFAVNFVTPPPPGRAVRSGLYRPVPDEWCRLCETELGAEVELLQDYGLGEYTLLARLRSPDKGRDAGALARQ
jgi:SAM-dependent methyltransferase